jgi:quinoprotein glucose dehydrogenase
VGAQTGTPYTVVRQQITAPASHLPCTAMPWGTVSAVNLNTAQPVFQVPLGTKIAGEHTGTINLGGDAVTASGLVFTAASEQPLLRAFDAATGAELWDGALPVPAQATPMSYTFQGRQYVVIAAGGHGLFGTPIGDSVVAFALPERAIH